MLQYVGPYGDGAVGLGTVYPYGGYVSKDRGEVTHVKLILDRS